MPAGTGQRGRAAPLESDGSVKGGGLADIDISREMVSRTSSYRGDLVLADAMNPPLRPRSFSTIVCAGSFYYLPDPVKALLEFHRLLTPGGRIVLLGPEAWFLRPVVRILVRRDYEVLARRAGLDLERCESLRGVASLVVMRNRISSGG